MSRKNIGKLGEKTLERWCAELEGIVTTRPAEDVNGWDYLVEFGPHNIDSSQPLDSIPPSISCWIQVKASDKRKGKWSIKLSNWLRLIHKPEPAFFLVFEFNGGSQPDGAFLVHIDKPLIKSVLWRLRTLGTNPNLHKKTLQFKYDKHHKLSTADIHGLKKAITTYVPNGMDTYIEWKRKARETVGRENSSYEMEITALFPEDCNGQDSLELLVDWSLGEIPKLEVTQFTVYDTRFDIRHPYPIRHETEGFIEIIRNEPFLSGEVIIQTADRRKRMLMQMDIITPIKFEFNLPRYAFKTIWKAPFIKWAVFPPRSGRHITISFELPEPNKPVPLKDLFQFASYMEVLKHSIDHNQDLIVTIKHNNQIYSLSQFKIKEKKLPYLKTCNQIGFAYNVARLYNIENQVIISLNEINRYTFLLIAISKSHLNHQDMRFHVKGSWGQELPKRKFVIPRLLHISFGNFQLFACLTIVSKPKLQLDDATASFYYQFTTKRPKLYDYIELESGEEIPKDILAKILNNVVNDYDEADIDTLMLKEESEIYHQYHLTEDSTDE